MSIALSMWVFTGVDLTFHGGSERLSIVLNYRGRCLLFKI